MTGFDQRNVELRQYLLGTSNGVGPDRRKRVSDVKDR
jgi:hypothetical protein